MSRQQHLEKAGRLTSGNAPLHVRRKDLANQLLVCKHSLETSLANWPEEYQIPLDHDLRELLRIMQHIATDLTTPPKP